jgi:antitoxin (DNA-binding transcriptional repressor) of toxin-antitoxin stability system
MYLNVSEAKTRFSELVDLVCSTDEEIIVGLRNVPRVKISPVREQKTRSKNRQLGKFKDDVIFMANDFNDTPEEFGETL